MRNWDEDDETGSEECPAKKDWLDVRAVCNQLDIPVHRINLVKEYWNNVFEPMLDGYSRGITPNPDILCNREIKFKKFLDIALKYGDCVATGHYARIEERADYNGNMKHHLLKGVDPVKDQSYFLTGVNSAALSKVLFPLGGMLKSEVRQIASDAGLVTANRKDSYGICFIGKRRFPNFISNYIPQSKGRFITVDGVDVGQHKGMGRYTIGQSSGVDGLKEKMYVVKKDIETNNIIVCRGRYHAALYTDWLSLPLSHFNWLTGEIPSGIINGGVIPISFRVRYRQVLNTGKMSIDYRAEDGTIPHLRIDFDQPQWCVTLGQTLAVYDGDVCLGGGEIVRHGETYHSMGKQLPAIDLFGEAAE